MKGFRRNWLMAAAVGGAVGAWGVALAYPQADQQDSSQASQNQGQQTMGSSGVGGAGSDVSAQGSQEQETKVLDELHHSNQSEIDMARIAQQNATDKKVKQFADRMVKDHTKLDKDVTDFASKHNLTLSDTMGGQMQGSQQMEHETATMDKLRSLKGPEFDHQYMTTMLQEHNKDIQKVTTALNETQNKDLKKLLQNTLTVIKEHKQLAQSWLQSHGAGQARSSSSSTR